MKTTFIETYANGVQLLGSDFSSVCRNIDTQRKLNNAINRHLVKLNSLKGIHPVLKGNFEIKYNSIYK